MRVLLAGEESATLSPRALPLRVQLAIFRALVLRNAGRLDRVEADETHLRGGGLVDEMETRHPQRRNSKINKPNESKSIYSTRSTQSQENTNRLQQNATWLSAWLAMQCDDGHSAFFHGLHGVERHRATTLRGRSQIAMTQGDTLGDLMRGHRQCPVS